MFFPLESGFFCCDHVSTYPALDRHGQTLPTLRAHVFQLPFHSPWFWIDCVVAVDFSRAWSSRVARQYRQSNSIGPRVIHTHGHWRFHSIDRSVRLLWCPSSQSDAPGIVFRLSVVVIIDTGRSRWPCRPLQALIGGENS